jgi:phosphoglycolate phosphatase
MTKRLAEIKPFPGVENVLATLQKDGYSIYIMSSNSESNIEKFLVTNNMRDYFTKIYGSIGLLGKARALRHIIAQNKFETDDVIYIGDEPRDIIAAKQVGVPCVAVAWGYNSPELLVDHSPMVIVKNAKQLLSVLQEWGSRVA